MNEDIQFLKDLQNEMNNQENDGQAAPRFWTIMDYRTVVGNEEYDNGHEQYFYNDGDHVQFDSFDDLKDFLENYYDEDIEEDEDLQSLLNNENGLDELWEYVEANLNNEGFFSSVFVKEEEFVAPNTMFLTKEEAKRHLELNYYHYSPKAHTYAMTAWRAPKVEKLIGILENFDWNSVEIK